MINQRHHFMIIASNGFDGVVVDSTTNSNRSSNGNPSNRIIGRHHNGTTSYNRNFRIISARSINVYGNKNNNNRFSFCDNANTQPRQDLTTEAIQRTTRRRMTGTYHHHQAKAAGAVTNNNSNGDDVSRTNNSGGKIDNGGKCRG